MTKKLKPIIAPDGTIFNPNSIDKITKAVILQSINPIVDKITDSIRPLLVDFVVKFYNQKIYKDEYLPIEIISTIYNIDIVTLNRWIKAKFINKYLCDGDIYLSNTEIREILHNLTTSISSQRSKNIKKVVEELKSMK